MGFTTTLRNTGLNALEGSLNALLRMDPESLARLAALEGKLIEIHARSPEFRCFVQPGADGIRLHAAVDRPPDTTLSGSALGLARSGLGNGDPRGALLSGDVRISGDLETGAALKAVLDGLDIDWEEQASRLVGDVLAHQLGNLARGLRRWAGEGADSLRHDLGDYLREESRLLADRHDTERLMASIDVLRADADRLEQRVERLRRRLAGARDAGDRADAATGSDE